MRYVLKLEAIGDNFNAYRRQIEKGVIKEFDKRAIRAYQLGNKRLSPWVALLTGIDDRYQFVRKFMDGQKDYSQANGTGSRGIWLYYPLKPGLYEINSPTSWKKSDRYFCKILDPDTLIRISREEAMRCLSED